MVSSAISKDLRLFNGDRAIVLSVGWPWFGQRYVPVNFARYGPVPLPEFDLITNWQSFDRCLVHGDPTGDCEALVSHAVVVLGGFH